LRTEKLRLDSLLLERNLCANLEIARSLILAGSVIVDEQKVTKAGLKFPKTAQIRITDKIPAYVSRGALKLKHAIEQFSIQATNRVCIDLGSSTGGFTEILLLKGARKIYAFDVGYGQMASRIRNNPVVKVVDRFNVKSLTWKDIGSHYTDLLIVMDLSFISLLSVYPALLQMKKESLNTRFEIISLVKPQFEVAKQELTKGVVRNRRVHFRVLKKICKYIKYEMKGHLLGLCESPIKGNAGNKEFFAYFVL
jgi:23S rRNA (cytidine1920-2'-O)/16S rRNA (cytidine1409-2'-O)-methyltransferase